ncbi:MAG TPA: AraC family transcriptional regulator [Chitinophagaceae bacterium]|nr:AraC family transcriptional regulator [Chitinophagaceae bacterium]
MDVKTIVPHESISLFVKSILVFNEKDKSEKAVLPFFADGYPGLMFQETATGLYVKPHNKKMPRLFLYGQTIQPIELVIDGAYQLIVFQLYPFVLKSFFDVSPKDLNDDCYDLTRVKHINTSEIINTLRVDESAENRITAIASFLHNMFQLKKDLLDFKIRQAIQLIIDNKGQVSIKEVCLHVKITARSFERRFLAQVGISPKQFSKIIQFDASLNQLNMKDYTKLTDIVYANGFADQSHFIRVFKAFTGTTPKKFSNF